MRKVKVRGLARLMAGLFAVWGACVAPKGLYDLFLGEPEANLYSPEPWQFVTREQWLRYAGFELLYGGTCLALAFFLLRYSRLLPDWVLREDPGT